LKVTIALSIANFAMFLITIIVFIVVLKKRQKIQNSKDKETIHPLIETKNQAVVIESKKTQSLQLMKQTQQHSQLINQVFILHKSTNKQTYSLFFINI
jgi:hypothetical protein